MIKIWRSPNKSDDKKAESLEKIKVRKSLPPDRNTGCLYAKFGNFILDGGWRGNRENIKKEKKRPYGNKQDFVAEEKNNKRQQEGYR